MSNFLDNEALISLRKSEGIYFRVAKLSEYIFDGDNLVDRDVQMKELIFLLEGIKGTDAHLTIFNHKTYAPELEVGHTEF